MWSCITASSDDRVQLPFTTHAGVYVSEHQIRLWPWILRPFARAHETIESAGAKLKLPRDGCSSSIFIALSAVNAS